MAEFLKQLQIQRWDDHRYYHHSRINQSLHLVSAISFVCAYAWLFKDPATAALIAWLISMTSRQAGHFFFEPKGYDAVNQATHEHKEDIKVGYNLRRKVVLMEPHTNSQGFIHNTGLMWLAIGVGGLLFRTIHLFFIKDVMSGLVWMSKILTDPFHDIKLYYKAPFALLRGEFIEPRKFH